ncbi:MAG: hypothetical protein GVY18_05415 [Bacteroidetes bacterium]|nr:hypothetical protein [Bacteroidota bacterium]
MLRSAVVHASPAALGSASTVQVGSSRSIPLALGLSALVPGLGQAYNRQWVKAAIGVGLEAAIIWGYTTSRSRGLDGRDAYQAYAHDFWSPVRYADWLNEYADWLRAEFGAPGEVNPITIPDPLMASGFDVTDPEGWSLDQRAAVRDLISDVNDMEQVVYHPETGASFSHQLPPFADQQYYELIGKYFQFAPGWTDYPDYLDENGDPIDDRMDPERTAADGGKPNVSDRFFQYADDHGQANDYLRRASRVSLFFVVNHLIAAVDAALSAKLHNDRLDTSLGFQPGPDGEAQPRASVSVQF